MGTCNVSVFIDRFNAHVDLSLPVALTEKEVILLRMLMHGMEVSQISRLRSRSAKTISHQKLSLYKKLGIENDVSFWRDILFKYISSVKIENQAHNVITENDYSLSSMFTQEEIINALRHNEFEPWLQPIICTKTGKIVGCEVLVRWIHPTLGLIMPEKFIGILESSEFLLPFTKRMMHLTKNILYSLNERLPDGFFVCFKVCEKVILDLSIIDSCENFINNFNKINIFLEQKNKNNFPTMHVYKTMINALLKKGIKFAIENFDLSYSPYYALSYHNIKMIKLSKFLISQIGTGNNVEYIIESISELSKKLNIEVCAQGVETFEQSTFLTSAGIVLQQGYYFSPPISSDVFARNYFLDVETKPGV
ncbi:EAL domain-containing protein [Escherichia coli]|nr:EAL domain-containing protein [Escherichia coli]